MASLSTITGLVAEKPDCPAMSAFLHLPAPVPLRQILFSSIRPIRRERRLSARALCRRHGPLLRFGNLGRNVFQGPTFLQMDMSLSKVFKITERVNLKFSAQAQNLTNHPSFDCIDSNLSSGTFGRAQCLAQSGGAGQSTTTQISSGGIGLPVARIMSIGLRLGF